MVGVISSYNQSTTQEKCLDKNNRFLGLSYPYPAYSLFIYPFNQICYPYAGRVLELIFGEGSNSLIFRLLSITFKCNEK